jgi:hypothetical protein
MKWTNYGKGFSTVSFHLKRKKKRRNRDPLRRFLDVGQSISSASPRVRARKHSLESRPQFRLF